ncbi:hypothetical protein GINT2_001023 [Glugoides intestinalis]
MNEHAISVINYHIGVLKFEPKDFCKMDDEIRKIRLGGQRVSSDVQMQGENYPVCNDLRGFGYELPQKVQNYNKEYDQSVHSIGSSEEEDCHEEVNELVNRIEAGTAEMIPAGAQE